MHVLQKMYEVKCKTQQGNVVPISRNVVCTKIVNEI
jgi:hypothetical protein